CATKNRSAAVAEPRMKFGSVRPPRRNTSTNSVDCRLSSADWLVQSDTTTSVAELRNRLQNTECTSGSSPSSPNSASGRSQWMPQGPSRISAATTGLDDSKLGMNVVHAQITKP